LGESGRLLVIGICLAHGSDDAIIPSIGRIGIGFIAHNALMSRPDNLPPTARAIALLLSSTPSVQDVQPAVLHQLLDFAHRYTAHVLTDANVYAEYAGRAGKIEMDDVVLAVQARVGWEFGGRVPKEVPRFPLAITRPNCS
jgi:transcription initiation factor TFIID subunit 9B